MIETPVTLRDVESYDSTISEEPPSPVESSGLRTGATVNDFRLAEMKMMEDRTCKGRVKWQAYLCGAMFENNTDVPRGIAALAAGISTLNICLFSGTSHVVASGAGFFTGLALFFILHSWSMCVTQAATKRFIDQSSFGYATVNERVQPGHALRVCNAAFTFLVCIICLGVIVYVSMECEHKDSCARAKHVIRNFGQSSNFTGWHLQGDDSI